MSNNKFVNESYDLNEIEAKVYEVLVERFGEPIGTVATVGIADEGPDGKKTVKDDALDRDWSDLNVVHEGEGCTCDESEEIDEISPSGWEGRFGAEGSYVDAAEMWDAENPESRRNLLASEMGFMPEDNRALASMTWSQLGEELDAATLKHLASVIRNYWG